MISMSHNQADSLAWALLTIDLAALKANYRMLADRVRPAELAAVVKADAYGLGAVNVAPALASAGCRHFFVAHLSEAAALRPHLPAACAIYVLNGLPPGTERRCTRLGVVPVLNSLDQVRRWVDAARWGKDRPPAALQLDSGMSRLGLSPAEVAMLAQDSALRSRLAPCLIMSHLACADTPEQAANANQLKQFLSLARQFPPAALSLANSGGAFLPSSFHLDLVRAGIALYGAAPQQDGINPMRPVVRLGARIIQIRTILAGTGVGYGLSFRPRGEARIATIGVGYADGWPRNLGNRGTVHFQGARLPIAGRVSMDSLSVDVTALPANSIKAGDWVDLIGPDQPLEEVALAAETIPYEILTRLGQRYDRIYLDDDGDPMLCPEKEAT